MDLPGRISVARPLREKRLLALLQGRRPEALGLDRAVERAQLTGSLELAGISVLDAEDRAPEMAALRRARQAVDPASSFTVAALLAWHRELKGPIGLRAGPAARDGEPAAAPPSFVASRLEILAHWLGTESARQLGSAQQGALVLARLLEIQPFDQANGRVARLAASHVMVRAGARPPILVGADADRLQRAVQWAFRLETEPLATLLDEAEGRAVDVMIGCLEGDQSPG